MFAIITYCMLVGSVQGCNVVVQHIPKAVDCDKYTLSIIRDVKKATPEIKYESVDHLCVSNYVVALQGAERTKKVLQDSGYHAVVEEIF